MHSGYCLLSDMFIENIFTVSSEKQKFIVLIKPEFIIFPFFWLVVYVLKLL